MKANHFLWSQVPPQSFKVWAARAQQAAPLQKNSVGWLAVHLQRDLQLQDGAAFAEAE